MQHDSDLKREVERTYERSDPSVPEEERADCTLTEKYLCGC